MCRYFFKAVVLLTLGVLAGCPSLPTNETISSTGQVSAPPPSDAIPWTTAQSFASLEAAGPATGTANVNLTYSSGGALAAAAITPPSGPVITYSNFSIGGGAIQKVSASIDPAADGSNNVALLANPTKSGWNYQSFGTWANGFAAGFMGNSSSGNFGSVTYGSATTVPQLSAVHAVGGIATYTGLSTGMYYDGTNHAMTSSNISLVANFGANTLNFTTSNTQGQNQGGTYAPLSFEISTTTPAVSFTSNNIDLTIGTTNSAGLSGTARVIFYGPNAEEVGGRFTMTSMTSSGTSTYSGAFGGKK